MDFVSQGWCSAPCASRGTTTAIGSQRFGRPLSRAARGHSHRRRRAWRFLGNYVFGRARRPRRAAALAKRAGCCLLSLILAEPASR